MVTLRELRDLRGWSQATLAAKIGVSPGSVYNWERGRTRPRRRDVLLLGELFGIDADSIEVANREESREGKLAGVATN